MAINKRCPRADLVSVGVRGVINSRLSSVREAVSAGFSMVEVMVSLLIIAIITTAAVAFIVSSLGGSSAQKERQQAIFVADQQMEQIKALPTSEISLTNDSSALVEGRTLAMVQTLWGQAAANDLNIPQQDDETSDLDYDPQAGQAGETLAVPTMPTVAKGGLTYQLYNFIDVCWLNDATQTCGTSETSTTTLDYRATVDVTWTSKTCKSGCSYSDSTIIDPALDPTFNTNISTPSGTITAESNSDPTISLSSTQVSSGVLYADSGADPNGNTCKTNASGASYPGTEVTVTGTSFQSGMTADLSGTARDSGSIAANSLYQPDATHVEFCIATGDQPGNYTVTLINTDKGHFPLTITEVPAIFSAGNWTKGTPTLSVKAGGVEVGATISLCESTTTIGCTSAVSSGTATWTDPGAATTSNSNFTVPEQVSTDSPVVTPASLANWTGPINGKTAILLITNPSDKTTATWTITAPNATSPGTSSGLPVGEAVARTITGTFSSSATVFTSCTTTSAISSQTTSAIAFSSLTASGGSGCGVGKTAVVSIYNPDGGSTSETYTIDALPTETSYSPSPVYIGASNSLVINGTNFIGPATVTVSPSTGVSWSSVTVNASNKITLANLVFTTAGNYQITVKNADGGTPTAAVPSLTVSAPSVTGVSPTSVNISASPSTTFTLTGSDLQSGAHISVVSGCGTMSPSSPTLNLSGQFTASFSAIGNCSLKVTNPDNSSATFPSAILVNPTVTGITPTSVGANSASKQFTLTGAGLANGQTITLVSGCGTMTPASATLSSSKFSASFSAAGTCTLKLTSGTASATFTLLTVDPAPAEISYLASPSVAKGTQSTITVTGSGFASGIALAVTPPGGGKLNQSSVTYNSPTSVTFTIQPSKTGTYTLQFTNLDGGVSNTFTIQDTS